MIESIDENTFKMSTWAIFELSRSDDILFGFLWLVTNSSFQTRLYVQPEISQIDDRGEIEDLTNDLINQIRVELAEKGDSIIF